jgi:hypothetical protein
MKKIALLTVLAVMASMAFSQIIVQATMGMDTGGEHKLSEDGFNQTFDVKSGFSPSLEAFVKNGNVLYGIGAEYQLSREVDLSEYDSEAKPKFGYTPVYALVKFQLPLMLSFKIEALGHIGYNLFRYDDDYAEDYEYSDSYYYEKETFKSVGGLYYAYGAGVVLGDRIVVQALVKNNKSALDWDYQYQSIWGDMEFESGTMEIENTQFQLSAGFRF